MTTPTSIDLEAYYQADETYSGVVNDDNGDPVDLTAGGSTNVEFQLAPEYGATPVLSKSLAGTTLTAGTAAGTAVGAYFFTITDNDWTSLPLTGPKRDWWHTVWRTSSAGVRMPVARGKFTVHGTVSSSVSS